MTKSTWLLTKKRLSFSKTVIRSFTKPLLFSFLFLFALGCEDEPLIPTSDYFFLRLDPGLQDICLNSWAQVNLSSNIPTLTFEDIELTAEVDGEPFGFITENGFFRAPSSISGDKQSVKIKATWLENPTVTATATMNVYANEANTFVEVFSEFGNASAPGSARLLLNRNGSYMLVGRQPDGVSNFRIINMDPVGRISWRRNYGRGNAYDIKPAGDGGFLASGTTTDDGQATATVVKIDAGGFASWQKGFGKGAARSIAVDNRNGDFVVATDKVDESDPANYILLTKADRRGNTIWFKNLGRGQVEQIQSAGDGGFLIAAYLSQQEVNNGIGFIKIDAQGEVEWEQQRTGIAGLSIEALEDNTGFLVAYTSQESGKSTMNVSQLSHEGSVLWSNNYASENHLILSDIHFNPEKEEIALIGTEEINANSARIFMLKTGLEGTETWRKRFSNQSIRGNGLAIEKTGEGGYVILGALFGQNVVIKTDENGAISPCEDFIN